MSPAAAHARHLTLSRFERAAGESFGCAEEAPIARFTLVTPTTIALATFATALAASLTYLV